MARKRVHLWISGYVQGVGYRANARQYAATLGLAGWVRNLADGRVEIVAEGEEGPLQALVAWCRRGPTHAEVETVDVRWEPYEGEFTRFGLAW
jgi:acylphosphatase